jgi:hypothetical protein
MQKPDTYYCDYLDVEDIARAIESSECFPVDRSVGEQRYKNMREKIREILAF